MLRRLPIIGVFGQGTPLPPERTALARETGAMIAALGCHLLTGGGYGVMEAASEGFTRVAERRGLSIGIVPRPPHGAFDEPHRGADGRIYPNPFVEIAIRTPLPPRAENWHETPARNHVNVLTADAIIALPGGAGTSNELEMAALYAGEDKAVPDRRKTILLGPSQEFSAAQRAAFVHATTCREARRYLTRILLHRGLPFLESETA